MLLEKQNNRSGINDLHLTIFTHIFVFLVCFDDVFIAVPVVRYIALTLRFFLSLRNAFAQ